MSNIARISAIVITIGVGLAIYRLISPRLHAYAITRPYGTGCVTTKTPNCYVWLLTVTDADGRPRSFGYFRYEAECEVAITQIEADLHATNGECRKLGMSLWTARPAAAPWP
jgi:hypothetical protein